MAAGPLSGKTVVFGVTGCIAAYKAVDVCSKLRKAGAEVFVIMTHNATKLVAPITFRTISANPVVIEMFEEPRQWNVEHIALAERADLFMVCPATANVIGKVAAGVADDFLTTTIMATTAPKIFIPAMNNNMYDNPVTQRNIKYLESLGDYHFMEPDTGRLASGKIGKGRFPEPDKILEFTVNAVSTARLLLGKRVLITAGPTREAIDPVRYLSNHSSGKMGFALAEEAQKMGACVTLVAGPTALEAPKGVEVVSVTTGLEMWDAVLSRFPEVDIAVMAAAVSDYRPETVANQKIKKSAESMQLSLVKNPDILSECGQIKSGQVLIGFAAETQDVVSNAATKLHKKNADMIVANDVSQGVFGSDYNKVSFVYADGTVQHMEQEKKSQVAQEVLKRALEITKR